MARTRSRPPKVDVTHLSPNYSQRSVWPPTLIVLHSTEGKNVTGLSDLRALGDWFGSTKSQVSAHVATDAEGHSARYVADANKAWHVAADNSIALGIEQVGSASQNYWPTAQLKATAKWVAHWSRLYGIPIAHDTRRGVCRHSDLGVAGGGHDDPGPAYPLDRVLRYARWYSRFGWTA